MSQAIYTLETMVLVSLVMTLGIFCLAVLGGIYYILVSKLYDWITR